jgi:hypothetical protein
MNKSTAATIVLFLLGIGSIFGPKLLELGESGFLTPSTITPIPEVPKDVPDLTPVFATSTDQKKAREHAMIASRLCDSIAQAIRQDQALEVPGFKYGVELNDLRLATLQYMLQGWKFGDTYKSFDPTVSAFLIKRTAGAEGELTPQMRDQWADAFDDLGKGFYKTYIDLFKATGGK